MTEAIMAITTNNRQGFAGKKGHAKIQALEDIEMHAEMRTATRISELDRVPVSYTHLTLPTMQ